MSIAFKMSVDDHGLGLALENLPKAVAKRIAKAALKEGSKPILAAIKSYIHSRTGLLAGGLKVRVARGDRAGRVAVLIQSWPTREKFAASRPGRKVAGGDAKDRYRVYYGTFVELGHKVRGAAGETVGYTGRVYKRKGVVGGRVDAHPFIAPGFDETADAAGEIIEQRLGEGIDKELLKSS